MPYECSSAAYVNYMFYLGVSYILLEGQLVWYQYI